MSRSLPPRELLMLTPGGVARIALRSPGVEAAASEALEWMDRWGRVLDPETLSLTTWCVADAGTPSTTAVTS